MRNLIRSVSSARLLAALAVLALPFAAGCASDAMAAPPVRDPNALVGTWIADSNAVFTAITVVIEAKVVTNYGGTTTATTRTCVNPNPCQLTGSVLEGTQNGADVAFSVSYREAPVGADIIGTFDASGAIVGKVVFRSNGTPSGPFPIRLHHP